MIDWFADGAHWTGDGGLWVLIYQHLIYSAVALICTMIVAFPIGCYCGHTGKGERLLLGCANALRALPSFGLIIILVIVLGPVFTSDLAFIIPSLIVLIALALPSIMLGIWSGITSIDRTVIDAARGMGYSDLRLLLTVELPCALPLIISGIRSATLQIISTATIAAYVSLGGLGRLIIDGRAQNDYPQMIAGAVLVALLALLVDCFFSLLIRIIVSPGILRRESLLKSPIRLFSTRNRSLLK
ncbi:ABC transporter permease [Pantoea sp. App145]|uniref:ABC transporter permease n=1 Tax=Pantoea sp. App145 TaxID=3071567 RepID=UPI003A808D12